MKQLSYFILLVISHIILPITSTQLKKPISKDKLLSRKRRFLVPQVSGWTFTVTGDLTVPLEFTGSSISADTSFTYNLDDGSISGRSFKTDSKYTSHEEHRHSILRTVESYLERMGGFSDGHGCILRAICEVSETPQNTDGFLGDMVNMMLAPVYLLDGVNGNLGEDTDYMIAQKDGYFGQDCSRYHQACPASLFSYIGGEDDQYGYNEQYGDQYGSSYSNYTADYSYPHSKNEI